MPAVDPVHESVEDEGLPEMMGTIFCDSLHVSPLGGEITGLSKVAVRVNPFWPASVIVESAAVPAATVTESREVRIIGS